MKPINMRFYPDTNFLAVLDTDGFSIQGAKRWPARQYSDQYIPPEANNVGPSQLGIEADLFALAVIIFQLMNNGIHPYQGIDAVPGLPTSIQDRIYAGLYAYGSRPSTLTAPARMSIHEYLDPSTRAMFDRAFAGAQAGRPRAGEWNDHLKTLIIRNILVKCPLHPTEHGHFGRGCGFCALDAKLKQPAPGPRPGRSAGWLPSHPSGHPPITPPVQPGQGWADQYRRAWIYAGIAGGAMLTGYLIVNRHSGLFAGRGTIPLSVRSYRGTIDGNIGVALKLHRTAFADNGKAELKGSYVYTRYNRRVTVTGYITTAGRFEFQGRDPTGTLIDNFSGYVAGDGSLSGDYTRQSDSKHMSFSFGAE
jgi:hypothetical protein